MTGGGEVVQNFEKKSLHDSAVYHRTQMKKEMILKQLKEKGCRITRQRLMLLEIILTEECSNCKEIYYKASKQDGNIGFATVYRMINLLEEIGAISRRNMYQVNCGRTCMDDREHFCTVELNDDTVIELPAAKWKQIMQKGLEESGYEVTDTIRSVVISS